MCLFVKVLVTASSCDALSVSHGQVACGIRACCLPLKDPPGHCNWVLVAVLQVLQHILNPAFLYSFEKGEGEQLLGPPNPEGDNPESITSVFITKVTTLVYINTFEN